ncbi:MAG: ligase-associated DNA damage response endonuclease PdeM [Parvularculaceae bacterium]
MTDCALIELCGEKLLAHPMGALFWPAQETLIVADLHFEKGSAYARRGVFLPPYDTRTTLKRLIVLCRRFNPRAVISLGDAFHDGEAEARIDKEDAELLTGLVAAQRWTWILGNHDAAPPKAFAGAASIEERLGPLVFRHEPLRGAARGELCGHLHPSARIKTESGSQRRRCFAADGSRMVLPAFGAYAGGLNILDAAFDRVFAARSAWALGARGVYRIAPGLLMPEENAPPLRAAR